MVMLRMWSVLWRENGHFTEVLTLTYVYFIVFYGQSVVFCFLYTVYLTFKSLGGGQFNGGRIVMLQRWPV